MEIKKGIKVVVQPINVRYGNSDPFEAEVLTCGSKYFTVDSPDCKFYKDSLRQVTDYKEAYKVYPDFQTLNDEKEDNENTALIRKYFSGWGKVKLTNEQLKGIVNIIQQNNETNSKD